MEEQRSASARRGERLVQHVATRVRRRCDRRVELDELVSMGTAGLLDAQHRFDPQAGAGFETYAYYRIRGAIYDGLRAMAALPVGMHRRNLAWRDGAAGPAPIRVTSLEALPERGAELADPGGPHELLARRERARRVARALAELPEPAAQLIYKHYFEELDLAVAGAELGLSKWGASRLHARAVALLRDALASLAPEPEPEAQPARALSAETDNVPRRR